MWSNLDTETKSVLLSAGVSLVFSIFYWCLDDYKKKKEKRKQFKTYKGYVKEILENVFHYHDTKKIRCTINSQKPKYYSLDELKFRLVIKDGNQEIDIDQDYIITLFLSFIQERELLDKKEMRLLTRILGRMSTEPWVYRAKYLDNNGKEIDSTVVIIQYKDTYISQLSRDFYCAVYKKNKDFYEKLLGQLEHKEFDERINKIIDRNINDLTSDS